MNARDLFQEAYNAHRCSPVQYELCYNKLMTEPPLEYSDEWDDKEVDIAELINLISAIPQLEMYLRGENEGNFKVIGTTLYTTNQYFPGENIKVITLQGVRNIDILIHEYLGY